MKKLAKIEKCNARKKLKTVVAGVTTTIHAVITEKSAKAVAASALVPAPLNIVPRTITAIDEIEVTAVEASTIVTETKIVG